MKIYIWQGNGISDAYHDDGTLVVAANSPEEARQIMLDDRAEKEARNIELEEAAKAAGYDYGEDSAYHWRRADETAMQAKMAEIDAKYPRAFEYSETWDGDTDSILRAPDQIIELDKPKFVAFNGGRYD